MSIRRYVHVLLAVAVLATSSLMLGGCKAQQQMQQQVADMGAKIDSNQNLVKTAHDEINKLKFEVGQLKGLVTKLGNVIVDLQKAEEERQKAMAEAKARADSSKKKGTAKKAAPNAKKKH